MSQIVIDAIDRKILKYLITNARMPFLEIARKCLRKVFVELIDEPERRNVLYQRQSRIHFEKNKAKVVSGILKLLKKEKES